MSKQHLTNCNLVLPNETVFGGSLLIDEDRISAVCPHGMTADCEEYDLGGSTLMPGMIDLHSDAIESLAEPRSGIYLPFELAAQQADQIAAMNGITTFFNAVSFAGEELGLRASDAPARLVRALNHYRPFARTDQRVHCRYEITVEQALPTILGFVADGSCHLTSYMDHSPGQGQFQDEANYRSYMTTRYGYSHDAITQLLQAKRVEGGDAVAIATRARQLAEAAAEFEIPFAGHDADSREHVQEMIQLGAAIAEFPMSSDAAEAGAEAGLHQAVGSVNVIRGGSQRSGMSAMNLIKLQQADCLCSDYVPATLLPAILKIVTELQLPLHQVAKLVTSNPAKAARLTDRGAIQVGLKADLFAFDHSLQPNLPPRVKATWSNGKLAFSAASRTAAAAIASHDSR